MESPQISKFENKISPSLLPIIVILAAIFFISGLLHILIRNLLSQQSNGQEDDSDHTQSRNVTAFQGRLHQLFRLHDSGVDQSFIDCLPVFPYRSIVGLKVDPFDCAVCLCEFEPDHKLRLIPTCSHAFHVDCIDTWLLSHSTCPLCRSSLLDSPAPAVLESAAESGRYSFSSLSDNNTNSIVCDDKLGENSAEDKVVQVKLGKFRNADVGSVLEGGDRKLDRRRCFSLGSYEYVMNETALLRVTVKPGKSLEPRKKESFSVSKIWLRSGGAKERNGNGESSRRAVSFRLPPFPRYDQFKGKSEEVGEVGSEKEVDVEAGSCNNSVVSVESQISQTPSFARRTLMWVVNRQNRVGSQL